MKRQRYSIHLIPPEGEPRPVDAAGGLAAALDAANDQANSTGLEVRVWDTQRARCIYTVPARQEAA
jgi:hypothetical protein